ncbi:MAG TPA: hypothetical protein DCL63_13315 [Firmicutes bacterium]|jgi:hypothetical protein|nr:hypothetical protein [Bacillota bacterium]
MVADVDPRSPAWEVGVRRGDVIEAVNCRPVSSTDEMLGAMNVSPIAIVMDVRSALPGRPAHVRTVQIRGARAGLGLHLVPQAGDYPDVRLARTGRVSLLIRCLKARLGRRRK